jgi:hypothetical protein
MAVKKLNIGAAWMFILGWAFVILLLTFFLQAKQYYGGNPIFRQRLEVKEPFQTGSGRKGTGASVEEPAGGGLTPGAPELEAPRAPYTLLRGWLPSVSDDSTPTGLDREMTAQRCYGVDFQTRLERTGNFRQLTNNYRRGDPNSCSGPVQDLVLRFYQTEPVPQVGCIQPYVEK